MLLLAVIASACAVNDANAESPEPVREIAVLRRTTEPSGGAVRSKRPDGATARALSAIAGIELAPRRVRLGGSEVYRLPRAMAPGDAELESVLARLRVQPDVIYADPVVRVRRPASRGARREPSESRAAVRSVAPDGDDADVAADESDLLQVPRIEHLMVVLEPGTGLDDAELVRLGALAGCTLRRERSMSGGGVLLAIDPPVAASQAERIARRLRADARVADAAPDMPMRGTSADPNDPEFTSRSYLGPASARPGAANVMGAWNVTTGSSAVTVAVLDSGIYRGHADFDPLRILNGYDFVSKNTPVGRDTPVGGSADGTPRDEDESDPIYDERNCSGRRSRILHGSHVAGVIGAWTNNRFGISGVDWAAKILPVRVLGACKEGVESDIIDGIRWAAGVSPQGPTDPLSDVRANTTPAQVINISIEIPSGSCDPLLQAAIDEAMAAGAIVVAAAGNNGIALPPPANCNGVIAVGGHELETGVFYGDSNFGVSLDISAPYDGYYSISLRDRVLEGQACPVSSFRSDKGTSQGAALVSGVVALMKAARPTLTAAEAESALRSTAVPFDHGECSDHDANECGPGRIDGAAAVAAVRGQSATASTGITRMGTLGSGAVLALNPLPPRLVAGGGHTCAIVSDGQLTCWGSNYSGQVGDGSNLDRSSPALVNVDAPVVAVAASMSGLEGSSNFDDTCSVTGAGDVYCWGRNYGVTPVKVPVAGAARSVAVSWLSHGCAVLWGAGAVQCWGNNESGQLGDGSVGGRRSTPSTVLGLESGAVSVSVGFGFSCALLAGISEGRWAMVRMRIARSRWPLR